MRGIVEPHLVEVNAGLVGSSPAHIEPAAEVRGRLHARQQLQTAQQVGFAYGRHLLQVFHFQGDDARLLAQFVFHRVCLRLHDYFLKPQYFPGQFDIPTQVLAGCQQQGISVHFIANVGYGENTGARGNAPQGEIAFAIAQGARLPRGTGDD